MAPRAAHNQKIAVDLAKAYHGTIDAEVKIMKQPRLFAFFALCFAGLLPATLGCQGQVIGGGGGTGGSGGAGGSGGSIPTTSSGTPETPAPSGNAQPAEGGYMVTLANYPSACADPGIQPNCGPSAWWNVRFVLPSSALVPGTVLPFDQLNGFVSEQLAQESGQPQCGYGGGTFFGGTVKVVSASTAELVLEVTGTQSNGIPTGGIDGTHTVPMCDGPTPNPNDGPAIAMKFSETPGNNGNSSVSCTGGGSFTDPDTLMLFVSNLGQSCVDPFHFEKACIAPRYQIAIQVPLNLQTIGSFPLQDLATVSLSGMANAPGSCSGGGGSYWDGTINVTAIDASSVTFTLSGTAETAFGLGNADGTYTAPRCF